MDAIEALMRPVPDEERLKALARSLRGRKNAADFFAGSTVPGLQKMAQGEQGYVQDVAERQGVLREAMERRNLDKAQHEASLAQRKEEADAMREWRAGEAEEQRALRLTIAQMGKNGGSGGGYGTRQEREQFQGTAGALQSFQAIKDSFSPEYGTPVPFPKAGSALNAFARMAPGMVPENVEKGAAWFGNFEQNFNIPERHKMFGAALTKTEKPLWEAATITPNMGGEYIQRRLEIQDRLMRRKAEQEVIRAIRSGKYSIDDVAFEYGSVLPNFEEIVSMADDPQAYEAYREAEAEQMTIMLAAEEAEAVPMKAISDYTDEELDGMSEEELKVLLGGE